LEFLLKLLSGNGFEADDVFAVRMALGEAFSNALRHGNRMDPSKRVGLSFVIGPSRFRARVEDEGEGFDPRAVPDPTVTEHLERPSGRGVLLMRHYMHSVRFNARGNAVSLVRRRPPACLPTIVLESTCTVSHD
jgi:serine/threonine-protein kinase RsbW